MIEAILIGLLKANVAAGVVVLLVIALRKPVRARFGARAAYLLWIAPLAAGLAALLAHPAARTLITPIVVGAAAMADEVAAQAPARLSAAPDLSTPLLALWLVGALAAVAVIARRQAAFNSAMGRLEPFGSGGAFRAEHAGVGPAVVGVLRPRIVAPADFERRFGPEERKLILAHEGVHLKSGDAGVNALASAIQCLCWFNPLVLIGVRTLRIDQELACDAAVVGRFPAQRRLYAELLLKTQLVGQPLPLGCHWPAGSEHPLKERIVMLKSPLPGRAARQVGLGLAVSVGVLSASLAWAAQPGAPSHLEPADAAKLAGPGQEVECKPDAKRELHNCEVKGSPFAVVATPADVAREWPAAAKKAGLTGWVVLQCTPNLTTGRLDGCAGYHYGGAAEKPELKTAFEKAAVRVAAVIRLKTPPGPNDFVLREQPGFFTIEFKDHPALPGNRMGSPPPTRYPDFLPGPDGKAAGPAKVSDAAPPARKVLAAFAGPAAPKAGPPPSGQMARTPAAALAAFLQSPNWSRRPTVEDLMQAYPAEAAKAHVEGDVVLHCQVTGTGKLADCSVLRETPQGAGFGAAALKLTALFEAREQTPAGGPKRGTDIRIPIRFRLPTPSPAPAT